MTTVRDARPGTRSIVVGVVDDRCSGSLAYALEVALEESATVRVVRVSTDHREDRTELGLPVVTEELDGDPVDVLAREGRGVDLLVVETPRDPVAALLDPFLVRLRRRSETLLVEVDRHGEVVRASGPEGWAYSAEADPTVSTPTAVPSAGGVICVGVDGSPASTAAVGWAVAMAAQTACTLRLVGVYGTSGAAVARTRQDAVDAVATVASRLPTPAPQSVVVQGEAADRLLDASRDAVLLVVGRHGTSGLIHSALGGVGETCARLARCPVVIVPAPAR
ncbi:MULTISPECIES: universal stress protein [Aeromicrobium]|uniref:universal stress protein n=1 Tax=Aeromicrobium TaxID=2040 RepID=UPI0006F6D24F|nr:MULTISPECIES: universal stress protein [Aeromicrobium]KQX75863.1 hypothetical protein ASD10_12165 [Aeromicrobium sp. Root472D3]